MANNKGENESQNFLLSLAERQDTPLTSPWWRLRIFGYLAGFCLTIMVAILSLLTKQPHFMWAPFCLTVVMVAFLWGIGPALTTLIFGILTFSFVIAPEYTLFSSDIWRDIVVLGPFVFEQCVIALLAAYHEVEHRRVIIAKQEIKAHSQELGAVNQQLKRANHLKDLFVTRAAHELRTPLTMILGEAQLAMRRINKAGNADMSTSTYKKHMEKIEKRSYELHILVESLIDLSSLHSEDVSLRRDCCDLGKLCYEVIEDQRIFSERSILLQLPPEVVTIQADCIRLSQVIINLTDNAIRYSPHDTEITVIVYPEYKHVVIEMHNEGPAISQEQQELLFEPFYRTPYAEAVFNEGWGLGLTVSKEVVECHGGKIWVESSEGKGITVFVQLPLQS